MHRLTNSRTRAKAAVLKAPRSHVKEIQCTSEYLTEENKNNKFEEKYALSSAHCNIIYNSQAM